MELNWQKPVPLDDGSRQNMIYSVDLERLPTSSGVYIFARVWGKGKSKSIEPLYVGKATNISKRIKQQLNNLRLMKSIHASKSGERVVWCAEVVTKPGQNKNKVVKLVESTLIRNFVALGFGLKNKQGVEIRRHEVLSLGHRSKTLIPQMLYLEIR